ncbi:hypothetical protein [Sphingobium xanthum]|uniref:hypothetical protein n=1 Tax=Sphingobium xanthum TaxID=1387165 RepID=UPI0015EC095B|nr:hypothetical protein [Sphingobium xanthum]MCW2362422.1 hypothetical protein [Sphingobium sp. B10D3B]MCW2400899.1 hypothetical protein [Sphingobium sp. B10D7B]MCW2407878.1 hypothetical protein [Sphingobium xanthum]
MLIVVDVGAKIGAACIWLRAKYRREMLYGICTDQPTEETFVWVCPEKRFFSFARKCALKALEIRAFNGGRGKD